jgi:hypothetical protein
VSELEQAHADEEAAIAAEMGEDQPAGDVGELAEDEPTGDVDDDADAEAAAGELPEDETPGAGEDELSADELAMQASVDAAGTLKKVSGAADRYVKKLVELLGPDLGGYAGCLLCDGFPPGLVILEQIDDERRNAVKRLLGLETFDDLVADDAYFEACPVCHGRGRLRTGSLVHSHEAEKCPRCNGFGFLRPAGVIALAEEPEPAAAPAGENGSSGERPPYDQWGTPSWHADYGKTLEYRDVPVDHWAGNLAAS